MKSIPLFDAHCDTVSRMCAKQFQTDSLADSSGHLDLSRTVGFAPYAQFFALFANRITPGPAMWDRYCMMLKRLRREVSANSQRITLCGTAQEACRAAEQGKAAAFISVEGAELLDCDLNRLEAAFRDGVRAVTVTWNYANALSGSHIDCPEQGLTERGVAFVRRMRELGMLVDVSHLSDRGFWDITDKVPGPLIATHSNAREIYFHTRNLTDEQITAIIQSRGVIGLNLYVEFVGPRPASVDDVRAHLDHILDLGGEDTVSLGGDWDGADPLVGGFDDIACWRVLYEELLRRNYSEELILNLFYNNMMRIVREVCST